jgi:hypothetical protein
MNVTYAARTFEQEKPEEWQRIYVWQGDHWLDGYYRFSDHHTYPHEIYKVPNDFSSRIECYTGDAEWMSYRD